MKKKKNKIEREVRHLENIESYLVVLVGIGTAGIIGLLLTHMIITYG